MVRGIRLALRGEVRASLSKSSMVESTHGTDGTFLALGLGRGFPLRGIMIKTVVVCLFDTTFTEITKTGKVSVT